MRTFKILVEKLNPETKQYKIFKLGKVDAIDYEGARREAADRWRNVAFFVREQGKPPPTDHFPSLDVWLAQPHDR